jgi:type VI secretion system protein ImpA
MAVKEVIDIESLLAPIAGDEPAGQPLPNDIRRKLDDLRREPDAFDLQAGAPDKRADWHGVIALAQDTLTNTSKDLLVAIRLCEGLSKRDHFYGLVAGFKLLTRLVTDCWDRIHPKPEPGEDDTARIGPFLWLNHALKGAKFPGTIASLRLFKRDETDYSFNYINETAKQEQKDEFQRVFDSLRPKELDEFKLVGEAVREAKVALTELSKALDARFSENAPDLLSEENPDNIGRVLQVAEREITKLMKSKGLLVDASAAAATGGEATTESSDGGDSIELAGGPRNMSREGLYRQIETIADALSRIEPHSPIPFLLRRVVKLGSLSFPELMKEIVRDSGTIDEVNRLLGIQSSE